MVGIWIWAVCLLGLLSCHSGRSHSEGAVLPGVTRTQMLATAERYRVHRWFAEAQHVRHGVDAAGIRVDTPDVSYASTGVVPGWWRAGEWNVGMPYQWGGFCSPESFDAGLRRGLAAGDVYTSQKRALLDAAVSTEAVGIDCSGFVSRCWGLPRSYSTRELAVVSDPLNGYDDLLPGDILNCYNAHCLLFAGWLDAERTRMQVYETGVPPHWRVVAHERKRRDLERGRFVPLRYGGVRNR